MKNSMNLCLLDNFASMKNKLTIIILLLLQFRLLGQKDDDSSVYVLYKNQPVVYGDIGYRGSPFTLKYPFSEDINKLKFKHNLKAVLGVGIHYKWFSFRLGIGLPGTIRPASRYGTHQTFNLGTQFSVKKTFIDLDFRVNDGYVIKDAYQWNDSLDNIHPNEIADNMRTSSLSVNFWHFRKNEIHMKPILARVGRYNRDAGSFYLKYTFNVFGVSRKTGSTPLTPLPFIKDNIPALNSFGFGVIDFGVVPGYAFVKKIDHWQLSFIGGLGGVLQMKFFSTLDVVSSRALIGIAPRVDFKFIGGYNHHKYFIHLDTDFDIKSATYQRLAYRQYYYSVRLVGGYRFKEKTKKEKSKRKE